MTPAAYSQVIVHRGERRVKEEVKQDPIGGRDTGCPAGEDLPCDRLESACITLAKEQRKQLSPRSLRSPR